MYVESEGIVLKQVKAIGGRRILVLLTAKYGKISAGTSISEKSKNRAALATRPFTLGRYEMFKSRDTYHINSAEVVKFYYKIGEDVDKFMHCSYVLELTEKMLSEEDPARQILELLKNYFAIMENRKKDFLTMTLVYKIKALQILGFAPEVKVGLDEVEKKEYYFNIPDGEISLKDSGQKLLYKVSFDIVKVLNFLMDNPLIKFENLTLEKETLEKIDVIFNAYIAYHLGIKDLKSEALI